ncbi:MAG: hypothetical protein AAF152_00935 [Cyanobacteria bacterium P01_A01_bin.114]
MAQARRAAYQVETFDEYSLIERGDRLIAAFLLPPYCRCTKRA